MLSIKLMRIGKKNLPSFRVVVGSGKKIVETLGNYYPHPKSPRFNVIKERIEYWRKSGARLTPAVAALLKGKYEFRRYVPKSGTKPEESAPTASPETPPAKINEVKEAPVETPSPEEKAPENA